MLDADGSLVGCSAVHSVSFVLCFSEASLSLCDAPSSTSTSCVRGDDVTQEVHMNVMRSRNEILRRFVDCFPSRLPATDGGFSLLDVVPFPFPLLLLRRERDLTGTVTEDAVQVAVAWPAVWLVSCDVLGAAIEASV